MLFIDQGEEGGIQDVFFLPEGAFCLGGVLARGGVLQEGRGLWPKGDFGRSGVLSGGGFCPVPGYIAHQIEIALSESNQKTDGKSKMCKLTGKRTLIQIRSKYSL